MSFMTPSMALAAAGLAIVLYLGYQWALPKPLKGIPYNKSAATNLFGDVPDLMKEFKTRGDLFLWIRDQNLKTRSAINQIFIEPFGRPVVVVADPRESRDIQINRTKEFDRSRYIIETFRPLLGSMQFPMRTGPEWKLHRRITQDTMTPSFLREVAAPSIYNSCLRFVEMWNIKADLAEGRPFSASKDMFHATLDAVLAFTFGPDFPLSATRPQLDSLVRSRGAKVDTGSSKYEPVKFPNLDAGEEIEGLLALIKTMESVQGKPLPRLQWFLKKRTAIFKHNEKMKNKIIRSEIGNAMDKFARCSQGKSELTARSGLDLIVRKEAKLAEKDNRKPDFFSDMIQDELFGFLVAGHDTTSSTMCWAMKYMSAYRHCQTRLRSELQAVFVAARSEGRQPTAEEIMGANIPYLDATMEEIFRFGSAAPISSREAVKDTEILGHFIPKGTVIMYLTNGPGFTMPTCTVDESKRGAQSQQDEKDGRYKSWDANDIDQFKPERWLIENKAESGEKGNGTITFDPNAGPTNVFGFGPRSCFGRRLAYVEYRLILTMIIWNFEFLECPKELSSNIGVFGIVYKPQQCYVRLKKVDHAAVAA